MQAIIFVHMFYATMLINKISSINNLYCAKKPHKNEATQEQIQAKTSYMMPAQAHYTHLVTPVSFTGGVSVDLGESIKNLDEYQGKHQDEQVYPPGVREAAQEIIDKGNPYKWTLVDVHKDVFGRLEAEGSLEKIKEIEEFRPLFDEVEPADNVQGQTDSLLERMKRGEFETFNPGKNEISVDLIRLLYAEGFSTTDLKKYTDGTDIYHTAHNKLKIPLLNSHYAHMLKLSDKDYNERLIHVIQETRKDNAERAKQEGIEPVFIRKTGGKEAAVDTAVELEKYFEEKPTEVYGQSENQRWFYKEHPEIAAKLTDLILIAWGGEKHSNLTSRMKKHFEKAGVKDIQIKDLDPFEITSENADILKGFWDKNPWAIKAFSEKLKTLRANEIPEKTPKTTSDGYLFKILPSGLVVDFVNWKKTRGIFEQGFYNPFMGNDGGVQDSDRYKATQNLLSKFFKGHNNANSSRMLKANLSTVEDLLNAFKTGEIKDVLGLENEIRIFLSSVSGPRYDEETDSVHEHISSNEAEALYQSIAKACITNGRKEGAKEILDFLYKRLDENYEIAKSEIKPSTGLPNNVPKKMELPKPAPGTAYVDFSTISDSKNRSFKVAPRDLLIRLDFWKKQKGISETTYHNSPMDKNGNYLIDLDILTKSGKVITNFYDDNPKFQDIIADTYSGSLQDLYARIIKEHGGSFESAKGAIKNPALVKVLEATHKDLILRLTTPRRDPDTGKMNRYVTATEASSAYSNVLEIIIKNDLDEYYRFLTNRLDVKYAKSKKDHGVSF